MAESSTILRGAVSSSKANSKIKFIVGGVIIVGLIAYLIISSISSAGAYYREVGEVLNQQATLTGKNLRVSGNIVTPSIKYDAATLNLNFMISDPQDAGKQLAIHFHGVQPDQIGPRGIERDRRRNTGPERCGRSEQPASQVPSRYEEYEEVKVEAVK